MKMRSTEAPLARIALLGCALILASFFAPFVATYAADRESLPPAVASQLKVIENAREAGLRNARNEAERGLIEEDLFFADDAKARHVSLAFSSRMAADGALVSPGDSIAFGSEGVQAALQADTSQWYWAPLHARVEGNLGVTWGIAAIVYRTQSDELKSIQTRYATVWKRNGGHWEIWLDIGNAGPPPDIMPQKRGH